MMCVFPLLLGLLAAGCASRSLPKYERPLARAQFQHVRTTAYTHTESDHRKYSNRNALGTSLQFGPMNSASCDWSRWPVGTVFRVQETGENYIVDDYGWALAGTNTIDLYKPSRSAMNAWGVRRVHLELIRWGDVRRSLAILRPRSKYRHVRRMVDEIEERYAELSRPLDLPIATLPEEKSFAPVAEFSGEAEPAGEVPRAVAVNALPTVADRPLGGFVPPSAGRVPLTPFVTDASR